LAFAVIGAGAQQEPNVLDDPNTLLSDGNCGVGVVESGGGVALSESAPAPLTASEPCPEHGRPVSGLFPVVSLLRIDPGAVEGVAGEIGISAVWGTVKIVIGLELFGLLVVCANALAVASRNIAAPSFKGLATITNLRRCHPRLELYTMAEAKGTKRAPH
jgi:hypothetical protein